MKIILTSNSSWNLYNFRRGLIKILIENHHKVTVVAPRDKFSDLLKDMGCEYFQIDINKRKINIINEMILVINYYKILKNIQPDFLITYTIKPNIYGSIAAKFFATKVVNTISGLGKIFINKGLLRSLVIYLYKFSLKKSYRVFFHNSDDLNFFLNLNIVNKERSVVVSGSGVNVDYFEFKPLPHINNNDLIFLYVGRIIYEKGVVELIEAAKKIFDIYPSIKFRLLGEIKENDKDYIDLDYIKFWAKKISLEFLGTNDDVRKYYKSSHCIILPSYREGLPKSLIEAGSIGRPSLASNVPGCIHIIEDSKNGLLFKVKDSESLFQTILKFIEMPKEMKVNMSINARKKVVENFNEKDVINRYLEVIN